MAGDYVDYPFHFDEKGRSAVTSADDHVLDMIHQVLFTNPGERVNRPEFGVGLLRAIFDPGAEEDLLAWQFLVQQALQRWLGDRIEVRSVTLEQRGTKLLVQIEYSELFSQVARTALFEVFVP